MDFLNNNREILRKVGWGTCCNRPPSGFHMMIVYFTILIELFRRHGNVLERAVVH